MARINLDDELDDDPRFQKLQRLVGRQTAYGVWRDVAKSAQKYWKKDRGLIPFDIFDCIENGEAMVECKLCERRETGVYLKGAADYFDWLVSKVDAGRLGGSVSSDAKRSAALAREQRKRDASSNAEKPQAPTSNHKQTTSEFKHSQASSSSSPSSSSASEDSKESSSAAAGACAAAAEDPSESGEDMGNQEPFVPATAAELLAIVPTGRLARWRRMYPDIGERERVALRVIDHYDGHHDQPKTVAQWRKALAHFLKNDFKISTHPPPDGRKPNASAYEEFHPPDQAERAAEIPAETRTKLARLTGRGSAEGRAKPARDSPEAVMAQAFEQN